MCHSKRRKRWAELLSVRSCSKFCRWFQRSCPTSLLFWLLFAETSSNATTETPPTHPPTSAPNDSRTTIPFITTTSTPSTSFLCVRFSHLSVLSYTVGTLLFMSIVTMSHCVSSCRRSESEDFLSVSTVWRLHQECPDTTGQSASYLIRSPVKAPDKHAEIL